MDKWMNERKGLNGWTKVTHGNEKRKGISTYLKNKYYPKYPGSKLKTNY